MNLHTLFHKVGGADVPLTDAAVKRLRYRADEAGIENLDIPYAIPFALHEIINDLTKHAAMRIYNHTLTPEITIENAQRTRLGDVVPTLSDACENAAAELSSRADLMHRIDDAVLHSEAISDENRQRLATVPHAFADDNIRLLKICRSEFAQTASQLQQFIATEGPTLDAETRDELSSAQAIADYSAKRCATIATVVQADAARIAPGERSR